MSADDDKLADQLAHLPVEDRRAFMDDDTRIQPEYHDRPSRDIALGVVATLTALATIYLVGVWLLGVLP